MKTIKMNYSASEMDPWSVEMRVVDFNVEFGIIYCELEDSRIKKCRDNRGYVMIPMDETFYKNGHFKIDTCYEMIMYVEYDNVLDWMNNTYL